MFQGGENAVIVPRRLPNDILPSARIQWALGVEDVGCDEIRVFDASLLQRLVHDLHYHDALGQRERVALLLTVPQAPRDLVGLPEHAHAEAALPVHGDGAVDDLDLAVAVLLDDLVLRGPVGRAGDLDLAKGALDLDGGAAAVLAVGVGGDAQRRQGDALRLVTWELHDDGRRLVRTRLVIRLDRGEGLGRLLLGLGLQVVEDLEHPCEGVDAQVEQRTACEVDVDHAVLVGEGQSPFRPVIVDGVVSYSDGCQ